MRIHVTASLVSILLALAALGISSQRASGPPASVAKVDTARLEEKLRIIEARLDSLPPTPAAAEATVAQPSRSAVEVDDATLRRLRDLEEALVGLEDAFYARLVEAARSKSDYPGKDEERLRSRMGREAMASYQAALVDPDARIEDRCAAIELLRRFPPDMDAMTPVIDDIQAILDGQYTDDEKKQVVDALDSFQDDRITDSYLAILHSSSSERLRAQVLRSLALYARDGEGVDESIRLIAETESGRLRQIAESLVE